MKILIVVGTVYGGAKLVAEEIQRVLGYHAHESQILEHPVGGDLGREFAKGDLDLLLICTSTTGSGDLPDELVEFHAELVDSPPRIVGLKYAVVALGDSSYGDTFCGGGLQLDEALTNAGATRVAETLKLDALETVTPEDDAVPWAKDLLGYGFIG